MLKTITLSTFLASAALIVGVQFAHSYREGPPNGKTGAPGDGTCSDCHGGNRNPLTNPQKFQVSADGGVNSYAPGQRIVLTVQHFTTGPDFGFELTSLNNANAKYGSLEIIDNVNTQLANGVSRQYAKQTLAGSDFKSWQVAWNAPAAVTDTSSVTFYAAGNHANGSGFPDAGDSIYISRLRIPQALTVVSERIIRSTSVRLFPNPCTDAVHVQMELAKAAPVVARLYSTSGVLKAERTFFIEAGTQTLRWAFGDKPASGTYILRLTAGGYSTSQRLTIN